MEISCGLNMKHKLKHFWWKCLHTILPVNEVIYSRTKQGDPICKCCGEGVESVEHLLFFCSNAVNIWRHSPILWDGIQEYRTNLWHWWDELIGAANREEGRKHITLTINICWQIWKSRNEVVFNGQGEEGVRRA
ncbi:hypothetical protein ACH5RR_005886 [Cinchona calisaya]|uniref:Reverse transcriptase zinc-binding domain-containing protein n=1 Tax=Cinchona calisaya TaxID=153742 RepID=A0ABD3AMH2_9GENT